jgi:hypothetical protein
LCLLQEMESQRLALEKHCSGRREPARPRPRRKSTTSSSENSTKSRSRPHDSKHSSRRTSYTLVDPSRPMRHFRVQSAATVSTVGTNNRDVDDVLALHFRSCTLFQNPTHRPDLPSPTLSGYGSADTDMAITPDTTLGVPASNEHTNTAEVTPQQGEKTLTVEPTTMHWMTDSTRKREYERIDKANRGLRGLVRRIVPRCVSGNPPPRFYEDNKSDAGSVRRYRMDLSEEEDEYDEKRSSLMAHQGFNKDPKSRPSTARTPKKKFSFCF